MRKKPPKRLPRWLPPDAVAREYTALLIAYVDDLREMTEKLFIPALPSIERQAGIVTDGWTEGVDDLTKMLSIAIDKENKFNFEALTLDIGQKTSTWNSKEWQKTLRAAFGVNTLNYEPWLNDQLKSFQKENLSLITSLKDKALTDVETLTQRGVRQGLRHEQIAKQIREVYGATASRAKLIARDQVSKLNGNLTQLRQQDIGVKEYTWRGVGDQRERSTHVAHNNKVFKWSEPPADTGHPGQDFQCRCWPEPILDDIFNYVSTPPQGVQPTPVPPPVVIVPPKKGPQKGVQPEWLKKKPPVFAPPLPAADVVIPKPVPKTAVKVVKPPVVPMAQPIVPPVIHRTPWDIQQGSGKRRTTIRPAALPSKVVPRVKPSRPPSADNFVAPAINNNQEAYDAVKHLDHDGVFELLKKYGIQSNLDDKVLQSEISITDYREVAASIVHNFRGMRAGDIGRRMQTLKIENFSQEYRHAYGTCTNQGHVKLNRKTMMDPLSARRIASDVDDGYLSRGCYGWKGVLDHEIGHAFTMRTIETKAVGAPQQFKDALKQLEGTSGSRIGSGISRYAMVNMDETIAEGWAEYLNNPKPRPLARLIGEAVDALKNY